MTRYLVATASVHVTAAAADYLESRLEPDDDVVVLGVHEPALAERDPGDAANVARSRLATALPTVETRDGDPTAEIRAAVDEHDPDVVVLGAHGGDPDGAAPGSTLSALLGTVGRPVVVVEP